MFADMKNYAPPHSLEAEQAVLGCCLLSPKECLAICVTEFGQFGESVFYDQRNRTIYAKMLVVQDSGLTPDLVTVGQHLHDHGLTWDGAIMYIAALPDATPSSAAIRDYTTIVLEKAVLRNAAEVCERMAHEAYNGAANDVWGYLDRLESEVLGLRKRNTQARSSRELVPKAVAALEAMYERGDGLTGLATGFIDLDKMTGGLQPGEMTVIAGYPSQGKTSLALNIADHVVLTQHKAVGVFSLEMTAEQLMTRSVCANARINIQNVRERKMAERDFRSLSMTAHKLSRAALYLDDQSGLSIGEVRARARQMKSQYGIEMFVVDYIQLMHSSGTCDSRQEAVAQISNGLKTLAKELGVPVIALSQLNDDGRLRESRAIGQDADNVLKLVRPEDAKTDYDAMPMDLHIDKQRNGPTGVVHLVFLRSFTRFENASKV